MADTLDKSLQVLFDRLDGFVSSKTVVGDPIQVGNVTILPLVEVSVGVGAGASEKTGSDKGAGGLGAKIIPSAVIAITEGGVQLVSVKNQDAVSKLIDMAPGVLNKLNFGPFAKKTAAPEAEPVEFESQTIVED